MKHIHDWPVTIPSMNRSHALRTDDKDRARDSRAPRSVTIPGPMDPVTSHLKRAYDPVRFERLPRDMRELLDQID